MQQLTLHLTGTAPLLMRRPTTVNPLDPITREIKKFTGKRKKTEEDHQTIARLEWESSIYHEAGVGVYVPGVNVETCLRDAGKVTKQGTAVTRGVIVTEDMLPLKYAGPNVNGSLQPLWDAHLRDYRRVGNQQNSVMRCRPMFPDWSLDVPLVFEPSVIDESDLRDIAERAGLMIGIGDYRPRFGRFEVS